MDEAKDLVREESRRIEMSIYKRMEADLKRFESRLDKIAATVRTDVRKEALLIRESIQELNEDVRKQIEKDVGSFDRRLTRIETRINTFLKKYGLEDD
jgi:hypothetical protein